MALYNWAPIADELKILDKEIVLNSMRLKWNLKIDEFCDDKNDDDCIKTTLESDLFKDF